MGIFKRVGDIVSANLNDMAERFESPETMLRQAIREMDAAVTKQMESAARIIADERLVESELSRCRKKSDELHTRAREAVARDDNEAARRWLSQRQEHQQLIAALDDQLAKGPLPTDQHETPAAARRHAQNSPSGGRADIACPDRP